MNRQKKVFERVVNPLIIKHLTDPFGGEASIAKDIPIKYLSYFKEVSAQKNAKKIRYRYRGSTTNSYNRPQEFCHLHGADRFAIYYR